MTSGVAPNPPVSEWHVPPGTASHPIPRLLFRLSAPVQWYEASTARIVVAECRNLFRRIAAILRTPYPKNGVILPPDPRPNAPHRWVDPSQRFEGACNDGIQQLQRTHPWCGILDFRIYAQGFQQGALWALGKIDTETGSAKSDRRP
jgi:hypothetical protein